ncbi:helix-turn-helix transcriptional regulator [Nitrospira sp. BLG_1]|uniref:helix-turn-helix transcriptional regulator n=1 Tax=Nitrospira sp. BLG_1 TaxID=3395883 RepID=UPI0039BD8D78
MRPLNLQEAAQFLRMSRSSLYQRKDIPRYRRPGSRALLFDQDELEAWVKTGRVELVLSSGVAIDPQVASQAAGSSSVSTGVLSSSDALDIRRSGVYHRNPRYR